MPINVVCPECSKKHRVKDEFQGRKFKCRECAHVLVVGSAARPAAEQSEGSSAESSETPDAEKRRKKHRRRRSESPAANEDLFGSALDKFQGDFGEDIVDEDNPYRAPSRRSGTVRKRGSDKPMSLVAKCFSFEGRINRGTYVTINLLSSFGFNLLSAGLLQLADSPEMLIAGLIMQLVLIIPALWMTLAVQVKRWHDRDKSGFMVFIMLIPFVGAIWVLIECVFLPGTPGENSYGPEPL